MNARLFTGLIHGPPGLLILTFLFVGCGESPTAPTEGVRVVRVTVGSEHACALDSEGRAYCWGVNLSGQLGTGETCYYSSDCYLTETAVPVESDIRFGDLVAGSGITCGLDPAGEVYCWGAGASGLLGPDGGVEPCRPSTDFVTYPRTVQPGCNPSPTLIFERPAMDRIYGGSGGMPICGIDIGRAAHCWGPGLNGVRGDGTEEDSPVPVPVSTDQLFQQLSVSQWAYRNVSPTYQNRYGFVCGVTVDGSVYCWGSNLRGEFGNGSGDTLATVPVRVSLPASISNVTTGETHACALTTSGMAYCWGSGYLGDSAFTNSGEPVPVAGDHRFTHLAAEWGGTCGVTTDGDVLCWGYAGGTGVGRTSTLETPTPIAGTLRFESIDAGGYRTCGVSVTGRVYCWGSIPTLVVFPELPQ